MRRAFRFLTLAAVAALVWTPTPAHADTWVAPFAGITFGATDSEGDHKGAFGVNAGGLSAGKMIGAEVDFGYLHHVFGDTGAIGSNYLLDLTGNLLVAAPQEWTGNSGVRPFLSVGLGLMRTYIEGHGTFPGLTENDAAYTIGGGVISYLGRHAGVRGDVRYFRNINHNSSTNPFDSTLGSLHFWRASVGLVIR